MGRGLLEAFPLYPFYYYMFLVQFDVCRYKKTILDIGNELQKYSGWSLIEELSKPEAQSKLHRTNIAQPAIFSMQV